MTSSQDVCIILSPLILNNVLMWQDRETQIFLIQLTWPSSSSVILVGLFVWDSVGFLPLLPLYFAGSSGPYLAVKCSSYENQLWGSPVWFLPSTPLLNELSSSWLKRPHIVMNLGTRTLNLTHSNCFSRMPLSVELFSLSTLNSFVNQNVILQLQT